MKTKKTSTLHFLPKIIIAFLAILLALGLNAQVREVRAISLGPVQLGESRIPIDLNDFELKSSLKHPNLKVNWVEGSTQWVRNEVNLLIPRARMAISYSSPSSSISFSYSGLSIIPEIKNNFYYTEIFVSLFDSEKIELYEDGKKIADLWTEGLPPKKQTKTNLIDYSCSPYNVQIEGIESEYLSAGCRLERIGIPGDEKPRLEITWSSTNLRLLSETPPPYVVVLSQSSSAAIQVKNRQGKLLTLTFKASLPARLHRFRVGLGLGPYTFDIQEEQKRKNRLTLSPTLYSNLMLTPSSSLRFFDALVAASGTFNNFGSYFAYDLANLFDNRIQVVPLIGFQHLYFKYDKDSSPYNHLIYPQGFEVNYRHAFGLENYLLGYGMFLSTSSDYEYKNIWLRFGKRSFAEINYIEWGREKKSAKMWGLSFGFPLFQLL